VRRALSAGAWRKQKVKGLSMNIFDSHCHLDDKGYDRELDRVVERARQAEVKAIMAVGIDLSSSRKAVAIAGSFDRVYASVGLHPHDARSGNDRTMADLQVLAGNAKVKAWGETGLDFNRMYSPREEQEQWFDRQVRIGAELNLPMIFHERDSRGRFLQMLKTHWGPGRKGVVHCFSGTDAELDAYLAMGLHIGITGILTIASRGQALRQMARRIPDERLLVETDAPYLTPAPERNKARRNEPAFVRTVLFKLAEIRQADPEALAAVTWANTCRLFNVPESD
jgi:TatD DNase family protein